MGLYLSQQQSVTKQKLGAFLLILAPYLMKFLSIVGTAAMFMVGGSILVHGLSPVHHLIERWVEMVSGFAVVGGLLHVIMPTIFDMLVGVIAGAMVLAVVTMGSRFMPKHT